MRYCYCHHLQNKNVLGLVDVWNSQMSDLAISDDQVGV